MICVTTVLSPSYFPLITHPACGIFFFFSKPQKTLVISTPKTLNAPLCREKKKSPLKCYRHTTQPYLRSVLDGVDLFLLTALSVFLLQPLFILGKKNLMSSTDLLCLEEESTRYHEPSFLSRNKIKTKIKTGERSKNSMCIYPPARSDADTHTGDTGAAPTAAASGGGGRSGGVGARSGAVPERDFSLFTMPFPSWPIRSQLL